MARRSTTLILALAGQMIGVGACSSSIPPYRTNDISLDRAVSNCLDNQRTLTALEAGGATLMMAASGQGLGMLSLDGDAQLGLTVSSAISGLVAVGLTTVTLGFRSRMKLKSCDAILHRYNDRLNFEIEHKLNPTPSPAIQTRPPRKPDIFQIQEYSASHCLDEPVQSTNPREPAPSATRTVQ